MKKIAIVTVDFNSEEETHDCLQSLGKLDVKNISLEIIVVDNASKIPFTLTSEEKSKNIFLIRNEINTGFSGGYNSGMKYAFERNADYIMVINNDTVVDKNLLQEFLTVAESDPKIGLLGPKIYFAKGHEYHKERYKKEDLGRVFWYAGGGFDWQNALSYHRGVDEVDSGQYNSLEETEFVTGCCMFLPRRVLENVGFLDDKYFLYFEDANFNMRIKNAGYKIMYVPKAFLWHVNAASSGVGSALHDYFITRNRMLFGMTYGTVRLKGALFRESIRLFLTGREWQKKGIQDFYLRKFGKGRFNV